MPPPRSKRKKIPKRRKLRGTPGAKSARRQIHSPRHANAISTEKKIGNLFEALVAVQARLRAPGGCPWDREQTHATLRTYVIEEAYEVLDAIEAGNAKELEEELGDLLLQVLFHADLAREAGAFNISGVISAIHDKMIRRHPHVFGDVKAETSGEVLKNWAQLKAKEKAPLSSSAKNSEVPAASTLDGVPRSLPALLEAYRLTRKAAQVGFDWEHVEGVLEKIEEELLELQSALVDSDREAIEEEVGDLLFSLVNLSRFLKLDPEVVLKKSNLKFSRRFREMERDAINSGRRLPELSKEKLEQLWSAAKLKARPQTAPAARS